MSCLDLIMLFDTTSVWCNFEVNVTLMHIESNLKKKICFGHVRIASMTIANLKIIFLYLIK